MKSKTSKRLLLCTMIIFTMLFSVLSVSAKETTRSKALKLYSKKLAAKQFELESSGYKVPSSSLKFVAVDMNKDNIPELLVYRKLTDTEYEVWVYTYKKGKLNHLALIEMWTSTRAPKMGWKINNKTGVIDITYEDCEILLRMTSKNKMEILQTVMQCGERVISLSHGLSYDTKYIKKSEFTKLKKKWLGSAKMSSFKFYTNTSKNRKNRLK